MFKKEDIKPGMAVVLGNGAKGIVLPVINTPRAIILIDYRDMVDTGSCDGYMDLETYNENLLSETLLDDFTIVKIYGLAKNPRKARSSDFSSRKLLWVREPESKEVTMAEVEKMFGCKVKIVKEEN